MGKYIEQVTTKWIFDREENPNLNISKEVDDNKLEHIYLYIESDMSMGNMGQYIRLTIEEARGVLEILTNIFTKEDRT